MSEFLDRLLHRETYNKVCETYERLCSRNNSGLEQFMRQQGLENDGSYEVKIMVYDHESDILALDEVYSKSDSIRRRFPKGYELFLDGRTKREANKYEFRKKVSEHADDIEYKQHIHDDYQDLILRFATSIPMLFGYDDSFSTMEKVVKEAVFIESMEDKCRIFQDRKREYPYTVSEIIFGKEMKDAVNDVTVISNLSAFSITENYLNMRAQASFQDYLEFSRNMAEIPDILDFSPKGLKVKERTVAALEDYLRKAKVEQDFKSITEEFRNAMVLGFMKRPEDFTIEEKQLAIDRKDFLKTINNVLETVLSKCRRKVSWRNAILGMVDKALEGRRYNLPNDIQKAFDNLAQQDIIDKVPSLVKENLGVKNVRFDDFSKEAEAARSLIISYKSISNSASYDQFIETVDVNDRDATIRAILGSEIYGSKERFADDYSIEKFYKLQSVMEQCATTFDKTYSFIISNLDAIKDYNNIKFGKSCYFIEDYDKIARKDPELFRYILKYKSQQTVLTHNDEDLPF